MRYTTIEQQGEMAYGQPRWGLLLTQEESERMRPTFSGFWLCLPIQTRTYITTTRCVETGEETTTRHTREITAGVYTMYAAIGRAFGRKHYDRKARMADGCDAYHLERDFGCTINPKRIGKAYNFACVQANSFADVAAFANYFGTRLPPDFYATYADILVEIKEAA